MATGVVGLPLLAAGPVGWALYGVLFVGSAALTAYALHRATQAAAERFRTTPVSHTEPCPQQSSEPDPPRKAPERPPLPRPIPPIWIQEGRETHPLKEDVEIALDEDSTDCGEIGKSIDIIQRDLRFRRWDMQQPRNRGGNPGHIQRYYKEQEILKRLIEVAKTLGCPYTSQADIEAQLPHNYPTPWY